MRGIRALAPLGLLLLAGCTTAAQPSAMVKEAIEPAGPCLPPGSSAEFLEWDMEGTNVLKLATEDGGYRLAVIEQYRAPDGRGMRVLWVEGKLVLVDPKPDDPEAAPWVDRGLVSEDNQALRRPVGTPCQWRPAGERSARKGGTPVQSPTAMVTRGVR